MIQSEIDTCECVVCVKMMLGLSTHEPHFALLREEVRFGGKESQKRWVWSGQNVIANFFSFV